MTSAAAVQSVELTQPLPPNLPKSSGDRTSEAEEASPPVEGEAEGGGEKSSVLVTGEGRNPDLKPRDDGSLVVLGDRDGAPGETTNRDLVIAARKERERRASVVPVAVVTDENIAEHAEGGRLTVANVRPIPEAQLEEARKTLDQYADKETYWRERAREIRQRWRDAFDSVDEIERETKELRRKFYAAEDPEFRSQEIEPAWELSKRRLAEVQEIIENAQNELDLLYEEGRRDGALEGWLRTGIELEPWPDEINQPTEPVDPEDAINRRDIEIDDPPPR